MLGGTRLPRSRGWFSPRPIALIVGERFAFLVVFARWIAQDEHHYALLGIVRDRRRDWLLLVGRLMLVKGRWRPRRLYKSPQSLGRSVTP